MPRRAPPSTYLRIIDRDRKRHRDEHAAESPAKRAAIPPKASPEYPRRKALQSDLARYYERCKADNRRRFKGERLKEYCSAVSWTIARRSGRYPDYPTFEREEPGAMKRGAGRRDSKGRFIKRRAPRRTQASAPRRRARHQVAGYTMHRKGRTVRVRPHTSREAYEAPRHRRRGGPRRPSRRPRGGTRPVIVVAQESMRRAGSRRLARRRSYSARTPPIFSIPGMLVFGFGGVLGAQTADMAARYFEGMDPSTQSPTLPSGITSVAQYNDLVQSAPPTLKRIAIELGVSALGFIGGGLAARAGHGLLALFGYGWGFGGLFHIGTALVDGYLVQPMFVSNGTLSNAGERMYHHEFTAQQAAAAAKTAGGATLGDPNAASRNGASIAAAARPGGGRALPPARQPHNPAALATLGQPAAASLAAVARNPAAPPVNSPAANGGGNTRYNPGGAGNGSGAGQGQPAPAPNQGQPLPAACAGGCAPDCGCDTCKTKRNPMVTGEPPLEDVAAYSHPMVRSMLVGSQRRPLARVA